MVASTLQDDLDLYKRGLRVYAQEINTKLQAIDSQYQLIIPDLAILNDDALLTAFIQSTIFSSQCFQSHCKMAPFKKILY
jgi:hypothetical protein